MAKVPNQTNTFDNWFYPNKTFYRIDSTTNITTQPEIIEICPKTYEFMCGVNTSCVLMIAVIGNTPNSISNFRLTAYTQKNKIYEKNPIKGSITKAGQYNYYWFSSNASFIDPSSYWEHVVATSIDNAGGDVDLYVSVMDARYPTSEDYDFKSDNMGPDDVAIRSTDEIWTKSGYNKIYGIIFVVGVKALTDNVNYTLIMTGPRRYEVNYTTLFNSMD